MSVCVKGLCIARNRVLFKVVTQPSHRAVMDGPCTPPFIELFNHFHTPAFRDKQVEWTRTQCDNVGAGSTGSKDWAGHFTHSHTTGVDLQDRLRWYYRPDGKHT